MELAYIVSLFVVFFCVVFNYTFPGNLRKGYPPLIFSGLWFFVILSHFICVNTGLLDIYVLSTEALFVFVGGVLVFTLGGFLGRTFFGGELSKTENTSNYAFLGQIDKIVLIIATAIAPIFLYESYQLAQEFMIFDSLFAGLRNAAAQGEEVGFSKYGIFFGYVGFFIQIFKYLQGKKNLKYLLWSIIIVLYYCILSTGRTFFLLFFCLALGAMIIFNILKTKHLLYSVGIFVILFGIIGVQLNKGGDIDASLGENVESIFNSMLEYFLGGASAFDELMKSNFQQVNGEKTLRLFFLLTGSSSQSTNQVDLVQDYVFVPFPTNVYTYYQAYLEDFGIGYAFSVLFIMSWLHTYIFFKAKNNGSFVYTFFYSILLYPLIMSFFQDQYLTIVTTWIYLGIIVFVCSRFIVKKPITS